ncbi:MAG: membrane-bound lytic murein transglycosylase MltF [Gammaproteobacteria bacterium]|nr:membrane-bound lytic murein transglycosylase MltF [Gammaproteobacteria bacterium]
MRGFAVIVLGTLLGSCSTPPPLIDQIMALGELRVLTRNSPTAFYFGADEPRGIEYELAKGFAARLGVDLRIVVEDRLGELLPDVAARKAHIGAASLAVTDARRQQISFAPAYQDVVQQVVYRRGTKRPKSPEDLLGGRIEVQVGSAHAELLKEAREQYPDLIWREDPRATIEELIRRVGEGVIDYTIVPSNSFALLRHSYPEARAAFPVGRPQALAWALPKGADRLREQVAAYFAEVQATGELDRMIERYYFAATRDFDYVGSRAFLRHIETRLPRYRRYFEEAELQTGIDWRLLAAIGYQESHWNPDAVSPTGVRGLMMLTRDTARMMEVADREAARDSVIGGANYFRRVREKIPQRIPEPDRTWLAVAAYNIGYGHLEDARIITEIQGGDPDRWDHVRERLPLLTDKEWYSRVKRGYARGHVPVQYVDNVRRYYDLLMWMADREVLTEYVAPAPAEEGPGSALQVTALNLPTLR